MTEAIKETKLPSATHSAVQKIKQLIFSGDLAADSNHLEAELARRLGLSRTPVREATLMLQAQGLLEVQPRKGIRIKAISVKDMEDTFDVLTELECLAARLAAAAGLTNKDLKVLRDRLKDMDSALAVENRKNWAIAKEAFHTELVRLGGNYQIGKIARNANDQVRRVRSITLNMRPLPVKSNKHYRKLCSAILKGDAVLADDAHRAYTQSAKELLISLLNDAGLKRV